VLSISLLGLTTAAYAQETSAPMPAGEAATPAPAADSTPVPAEEPTVVAAPAAATATSTTFPQYGVAMRMRWISVPSWFLGLFTQKNVALSTYGYALEGYRRKHDREDHNRTWELSLAIGYQNMSPSDGFWLGKNKDINVDTDLVQFRNFSLITMDAAFVSRQYFSRYFGIHYGAGLGLAVVRGKILRTSAQCDPSTGNCQVVISDPGNVCGGAGRPACTEANLQKSEGIPDGGPFGPHRFQETSVPGAIPILNLLFGLDFPVPDAKGLEFRVEGGFYDAFFVGGTAGYLF
jgi:hypothetical protein